jgi:hypothetical protein
MKALAARAVAVCGPLARVQVACGVWSSSPRRSFTEKRFSLPHPIPILIDPISLPSPPSYSLLATIPPVIPSMELPASPAAASVSGTFGLPPNTSCSFDRIRRRAEVRPILHVDLPSRSR